MISVCIPVYNFDVREFAEQLSEEIINLKIPAEGIFMDDGSPEDILSVNREILKLPGISYVETHENIGRAAIRNKLGRKAAYPWLLFLDADSLLPGTGFLNRYISALEDAAVICGGTIYRKEPPEDPSQRLRWTYGIHREQLSARIRSQRSSFAITSNNFLIPRGTFLETGFREEIKGYGHEDTVLGYDLFRKGIRIKHTDNPVLHTGLENSMEYLDKTRSALKNLLFIEDLVAHNPEFIRCSGLLRRLHRLESWHLIPFTAFVFRLLESMMQRNLTGTRPSLLFFDLYRLGYLCQSRKTYRGK
jgi:glycosyltransferase involved in cell wall biosynthesis